MVEYYVSVHSAQKPASHTKITEWQQVSAPSTAQETVSRTRYDLKMPEYHVSIHSATQKTASRNS